ncbi:MULTISPECIES: hypothetical protein [Bacillus]|uniref:hypothetical protein n=1 Tax=Bacillus TaxID=1386 RepID=UPI0012FC373B|nr:MULTISPECIES: hypothetical protein [Bacillus]MCU5332147.1 hypothetical protein [Bacillus wiedmannii]MCU5499982.1 hypothetical protein [Bacillus wiedmannii]MED2885676.1 hypothetical protein [Bacillus wiedmannii]
MKVWQSVEELHNHAKQAIGRQKKNLIKPKSMQKYFDNPKNKLSTMDFEKIGL